LQRTNSDAFGSKTVRNLIWDWATCVYSVAQATQNNFSGLAPKTNACFGKKLEERLASVAEVLIVRESR